MKKYRSRMDIAAEILEAAQTRAGANKTKIMYHAFLSFPQLKQYLALLMENQLLEHVPEDKNLYRTTEKGKRFLINYREIEPRANGETSP
jgi:predicted transcriptional regulator